MNELLKFSPGNAKLIGIPSLSLSAGWACPFANECYAKVDPITGKITDGPNQKFRCFSASQENIFPQTRKQRQYNFDLLKKIKSVKEMALLIEKSLPHEKYNIIRIHVSGDFFNITYLKAWILVAKRNPDRMFYTYTKSIPYLVQELNNIPSNLRITASKGGKHDNLIEKYNLKFAQVVYSIEEAEILGLKIDHDDSLAYAYDESFALLVHGTQQSGSQASIAKQKLAKNGWTGYSRKAA